MRRLVFAVILFVMAIGIVSYGRTNQAAEIRTTEVYSVDANVEF